MSRQNLSRANNYFQGRAALGNYQQGKPGLECSLMYRWRPSGLRAITFTGALAAGATTATLSAAWGGQSGIWPITFSDTEVLQANLVNGQTSVTFLPGSFPQTGGAYIQSGYAGAPTFSGLVNAVTANATVSAQPPVLGVANSILTTSAITTPVVPNGVSSTGITGAFDVPRNVVAAWTGTAVLTITGTDYWGYPQTESSASGTTFTGKKAFSTVTSISVSANVTAATVGAGNALGMPFKMAQGDLFSLQFGGLADTGALTVADLTSPATSTTGDVRGTVTLTGTLNGSSVVGAILKPFDSSTQVGSFGVTPA